jgi:hypothetical protein
MWVSTTLPASALRASLATPDGVRCPSTAKSSGKDLLTAYNAYCEDVGHGGMTSTAFGLALKRIRPNLNEAQRTVGGRPKQKVWLGIGLKTPDGDGPSPPGPGVEYTDGKPDDSPGSPTSPGSPGSSIVNSFILDTDNTEQKGETLKNNNKGNPVNAENPPRDRVARALDALEHGNAPKKALEHFSDGHQTHDDVARSVMLYLGVKHETLDEWRAPVVRAIRVALDGLGAGT